jgi:hypothetical protein
MKSKKKKKHEVLRADRGHGQRGREPNFRRETKGEGVFVNMVKRVWITSKLVHILMCPLHKDQIGRRKVVCQRVISRARKKTKFTKKQKKEEGHTMWTGCEI